MLYLSELMINMENYMNIAIIDDHSIVVEGFKRLLEADNYVISFVANSLAEARNKLITHNSDVVILDISLPDGMGFDLIPEIQAQNPSCKILVTSMYHKEPYPSRALRAGAHGYISKIEGADHLCEAITTLMSGAQYIGTDILHNIESAKKNNTNQKIANLTDRELFIFKHFALGHTVKNIAKEMAIMPKTVHAHRANIIKKTGIREVSDMLKIAVELNIIDLQEIERLPTSA